MEGGQATKVIQESEQIWNELAPAHPFNYAFLDEQLDQLYQAELQQGRLFSFFAGIAIFIACMGIFGLSAFAAAQRTKEIGIRKVLGASVGSIVQLLSKDFLKLVVLALLIATPIAWYFMRQWLDNFAYRIDIQWWVFPVAGFLALTVAFLTISFQSTKAALQNPVDSLRSD